MTTKKLYDYYMWNWEETKGFRVGAFESDEKFWEHYWQNKEIAAHCKKLDAGNWYMSRYPHSPLKISNIHDSI